uniref:Uncharacterized protein n=1 Tax=uncultured bacterium contig00086 TaxID=1181559 RepID=A0A806KRF1_9BACT|nr:hypothetical protein [uncultured bacterium contig00086]
MSPAAYRSAPAGGTECLRQGHHGATDIRLPLLPSGPGGVGRCPFA